MWIVVLSIVAGVLSVLSPCVLPLLPVIVGGSLSGSKWRPYVIASSLLVSLIAFTLLLKVSSAFLHVSPQVWQVVSGVLIVVLGVVMLVPAIWEKVARATRLDQSSRLLGRVNGQGVGASILTGVALGPVFSSCSPMYAWVIATVLPASPRMAMVYLAAYCVGLVVALLGFALLGRRLLAKTSWAANPYGWFQRVIAVLFIITGLLVATGVGRAIEVWAAQRLPSISGLEQKLVPTGPSRSGSDVFNAEGPAPEFQGISEWINTSPLTMAELRGKVVLIDFWTYSCINCLRAQPVLNAWHKRYHDDGLVIIGVHAPEFAFEKAPENVRRAVKELGISYPVALDNDYGTWSAYGNQYWPAKYLVDRQGRVRYVHFGEGQYYETERAIRELLNSSGDAASYGELESYSAGQSPETYLGSERAEGFVGNPEFKAGVTTYRAKNQLRAHQWTLNGQWNVDKEKSTAGENGATMRYSFTGRRVFLVLDGPPGARVKVELGGGREPGGTDVQGGHVTLDGARLYRLVDLGKPGSGTLTLTFDKSVSAHAFTFG